MARLRKFFIHGSVVELTFRAEAGLPFVATDYMRLIVLSYLARAQKFYPLSICAVVVMGNHVHMLVVVRNPELVPKFMEYFKRETAHAVNRLWGRKRRTVWSEGYDSPIVLDYEKVIQRLVYFYTNPQRAGLSDSIERYGQFTTWSAFAACVTRSVERVPIFPRYAVPTLGKTSRKITPRLAAEILDHITAFIDDWTELSIEPFAWMRCFDNRRAQTELEVVEEVQRLMSVIERQGVAAAVGQPRDAASLVDRSFEPRDWRPRTLCLATESEVRRTYARWFEEMANNAKHIIRRWIDFSGVLHLPPGFFAPGGAMFANFNPVCRVW